MLKPLIELFFATALWGFSFTATLWVLDFLDPSAIIFYRFMGAAVLGMIPVLFFRDSWRKRGQLLIDEFKASFLAGVWTFLTIAFQTWGLRSTSATKSAFITILYVIFIPMITGLTGREKLNWRHYASVMLAIVGMGVFQNLRWEGWNFGDSLTLVCALTASFQILAVAEQAPQTKSPYFFNLGMSFWTGTLALSYFLLTSPFLAEGMHWDRWSLIALDLKSAISLLILAVGCGLGAFYFQVRAQEKLPPSLASMLFLLESPFSALFAYFLLKEKLELHHLAGSALILGACAWAIRTDLPGEVETHL